MGATKKVNDVENRNFRFCHLEIVCDTIFCEGGQNFQKFVPQNLMSHELMVLVLGLTLIKY